MTNVQVHQVFKPVPEHDLIYAGDWGDIYTMKGRYNHKYSYPRKLTLVNSNGYKKVYIGGRDYLAHRLIMAAHVGVCDAPVNHIDGNKANNYIKNLEYCTQQYNIWHYHNITKPKVKTNLPEHLIEKVECYILGTNLRLTEIALELGVCIDDVEIIKKKLDTGR